MADYIGIKRYDISGLKSLMESWHEPAFRATQLLQWLYPEGVSSYQEMTNLPKALRQKLEEREPLYCPEMLDCQISTDGTRKYLLQLADGLCVETVGIPDDSRLTVCFSTQVGCAMGCVFCATGGGGLIRSLETGEMVDQLTVVSRDMGMRVTNAVAMGEGEPFANYEATLAALRIMNSPHGLNIGARHLTISTCGLTRQIDRFSYEPEQFTLAVSLHSAVQETRDLLMPALAGFGLDDLRRSLVGYTNKTGRRLSFEITLIDGINDTVFEVDALLDFIKGLLCHVNLIPFNRVFEARFPDVASEPEKKERHVHVSAPQRFKHAGASLFRPSSIDRVREIAAVIQKAGIECSIRRSRGSDIHGACGQLKGMRSQESSEA